MRLYGKISTALSTLLVFFWLWCMWSLRLDFKQYPASDGSGGNLSFLIAAALLFIVGVPLIHSSVLVVRAVSDKARNTPLARKLAALHVLLWVALPAGLVLPGIARDYDQYQQDHTARALAYRASDEGSVEDFDKYYPQALKELSTDWTRWNFKNSVQYDAEIHARTIIMKRLQEKWEPSLYTRGEYAWSSGLLTVLGSGASNSQDKLQAVKWLVDEGKPLGFSLRGESAKFSSASMFMTAYRHLDDPATQELVDLLVANGVDMIACTGEYECPLIGQADVNELVAVRYLLAHGAPVDQKRRGDGATALSIAIERSFPQMVKLLLDAGAQPTFGEDRNDVVSACDPDRVKGRGMPFDGKQVLQVLRDAHVHVSAQDMARYRRPIGDLQQSDCVRAFM